MKNQPFVSRSTMRCRCWLDHGSPTTSSSEDAETGSVCREFSSTYASTPSITTVKKSRTGNSAHRRPAVITYLQTASSTTTSGLARSDCRVQTATNRRRPHTSTVPFAMLQCRSLVMGKSIIIYSVGRIDSNRFAQLNRFG